MTTVSPRPTRRWAALAALAALAGPARPVALAQPPDPSAETIVIRRCLVDYEFKTQVGVPNYGTVQDCLVRPGDRVKAGQVLGRLQDGDARADVALREAEASSDIEVRVAEARSALATAKLQRTASLLRKGASSQEEFIEHKQGAVAAALEVEQAKHKRKVSAFQLQHARAVLGNRALVSPHDGVVTDVLRRKGESVAPLDPVFKVVDPSILRVVCQVDVAEAGRLRVGQPVRVVAEVAGADLEFEKQALPGTVSFIDEQYDPMTRTCKVFVRAANPGALLRAGLEARVEIDPAPEPEPAPAPAPAAPRAPGPAGVG